MKKVPQPLMFTGLFDFTPVITPAGEFLAANKGLGYLIIYGSQVFKMDLVMTSIVILCVVSAVLYQGIAGLEKRIK